MLEINTKTDSEKIFTDEDLSIEAAKAQLKGKTIAMIGYGRQGRAQALNLRDQGFEVIIGQRKGSNNYEKAIQEGWIPGKDLLEINLTLEKDTILGLMVSDDALIRLWSEFSQYFTPEKTLYFSHGFGITFHQQTKVNPPNNMDIILVAPKGAGDTVRDQFLLGTGINSSMAIYQNISGEEEKNALTLARGIGSGYIFPTNFEHEAISDLVGERWGESVP